jgi:hypothetical protein
MLEACWGQVDEIFISYRMTFRSQLLDGRSHIDCIPGYHSIGEQIQAASLIGLGLFRGRIAPRGAARAQGPRRSLKKSADGSAIPLHSAPPAVICPARLEGEGSRGQQSEVRSARLTAQRRRDAR